MTSRSPSPLAAAESAPPSAKSVSAREASSSGHAAHYSSPAAATTAPARYSSTASHPANNTELNSTNNVTSISQNARYSAQQPHSSALPNERQPVTAAVAAAARTAHLPRSSGPLSSSTSRSPSSAASPHSSRDSSPAGRVFRQQSVPGAGMRNSQDVSPHRPPSITGYTSSVPSAAAIQRALSAATTPQLQPAPTSEPASRVPRPARGGTSSTSTPSESNTPSWPISPRLKSPPPSGSRRNSLRTQKRGDAGTPNITIQGATPTSSTDALPLIDQELEQELRQSAQLGKTSTRETRGASGATTLETVQETSGPNTPGNDLSAFSSNDPNQKYFDMPGEKTPPGSTTPRRSMAPPAPKPMKASNSDSDGTEKKAEPKKAQEQDPDTTPRPKAPSTRASYSSLRQKTAAEPVTRSMTVETETVNSVAQNTIGAPSDRVSSRTDGGTLRQKASNDTIKPSKSRKKASRKAPSITATGGMYDPFPFSPPNTVVSPPLRSPRLRRREPHYFLTGGEQHQRPRSSQSASNMSFNFDNSYGTTLDARSEAEVNLAPEQQPSRLQLLRRQSSQWLGYYFSASMTSPIRTDFRTREGSTRADIFEDRVRDAMGEETSDDSDETFVYESNPAEPPIRRSRHHSRTPSGASLTSMGGQRDARHQGQGLLNTTKTRSMKFANAYNSADDENMERGIDGTIRGTNQSNRGSAVHHHHTGRPSRSTTGHTSILDDDSPFPQLNKVRSLTSVPGRHSQNSRIAARNLQASNGNGTGNGNGNGFGRKTDGGFMSYDLDAEGGDDERTPLIANTGTVRTPRSIRRPPTRDSRTPRYPRRRQGILARFAGCVAIMAMLFLLVFGIVGFLFIITTPLEMVQIYEIQSTLASETEIMFDLKVGAVNPNLLPISIGEVDFNVFAKSKYVGTEKWWRDHPNGDWADEPLPPKKLSPIEARGKRSSISGRDEEKDFLPKIPGSWPGDDDDLDDGSDSKQTMLLGRVYNLDNPLNFDPSFLKRHVHNSTAAMRVQNPGNKTELGGSERWERVVLHPFDLIVRGTLKYTIPLGGRAYATNVGARVTVDPQKDEGPGEGEGKDPKDGDDKKEDGDDEGKTVIRRQPPRYSFTIHALEEEDALHSRLKRRVFARLLRSS